MVTCTCHGIPPAQLSGNEDQDLELETLLNSERRDPLTRAKKLIYRLVKKVGFFGILLAASVSASWGGDLDQQCLSQDKI